MNTFKPSRLSLIKRLGLGAAIAVLALSALPPTSVLTQGDSPLPTPEPPTAEPIPTPEPPTPAPTATPRSTRAVPTPRLITRRIQELGAAGPFEVDMKYPAVANAGEVWSPFNAIAEAQVAEVIAAFKQEVATGTFTATEVSTSTLTSTWQPFRATRDFISTRMTVGIYMAGAAHPNSFTRVINYDPRTGTNLTLDQLFKPEADYLGVISAYCTRVLERRGLLIFPEGAAPNPENYANWNIGRSSLVIRFDPYQVAPYAAGPQDCSVPLSTLRRLFADPRRW